MFHGEQFKQILLTTISDVWNNRTMTLINASGNRLDFSRFEKLGAGETRESIRYRTRVITASGDKSLTRFSISLSMEASEGRTSFRTCEFWRADRPVSS